MGLYFDHIDSPVELCSDIMPSIRLDGGYTITVTLRNNSWSSISGGLCLWYQAACDDCNFVPAQKLPLNADGSGDGHTGANMLAPKVIPGNGWNTFTFGCKGELSAASTIFIQAFVQGSTATDTWDPGDDLNAEFCLAEAARLGAIPHAAIFSVGASYKRVKKERPSPKRP